tara:strand:+ start:380 stop:1003 length:624 start_codon:yes stop_codon:yes gene_type:complete
MKNIFKHPVVILANGVFPRHSTPLNFLSSAGTVICTDGSANSLDSLGLKPHVIIGDNDSIKRKDSFKGLIIDDPNQNNSDLEKAIEFSVMNNQKGIVILGATGGRDDMSYANIQLLFKYQEKIAIKMITDHFSIECLIGSKVFTSFNGQRISLVTKKHNTTINTLNLKYNINGKINSSVSLISNESLGNEFTLSSSEPLIVFRGHKK